METDGDKAAEGKKGGSKLIIIVAVVVLLLGGGGGFYFWRASSAAAAEAKDKKASDKKKASKETEDAPPAAEAKADPKAKKASTAPDPLENALPSDDEVKKIIELPPFIVNLADTEQARYLRMSVSLGVDGEEKAGEKPDQLFMTRVKNAMLAVLSDRKSEEILSSEGKAKLRKQLLSAAQAASEFGDGFSGLAVSGGTG